MTQRIWSFWDLAKFSLVVCFLMLKKLHTDATTNGDIYLKILGGPLYICV